MKACLATTVVLALCGLLTAQADQPLPEIIWMTNGPDAHFDVVRSVAFSADSSRLASGSQDRHAKVWSVPDGALLRDVYTVNEWVMAVGLSSDGSLLATGGDDGATRMWQLSDGRRLWQTGQSENIIRSVAFTLDGTRMADASRFGVIAVRDPVTGSGVPFDAHDDDVTTVAFSADGSRLASSSLDGSARIWRVSDAAVIQVFSGHSILSTNEEENVFNAVWSVDISPDGSLVATSGADQTIRLWRMSDGVQVRVIPSINCTVVKFSADGQLLLTANLGPINVWRVSTGQLLCSYPDANALPLAVAPNGRYFAYGRFDGSVVLALMPLWSESITHTNDEVTLRWQGGSGRYQVQARSELGGSSWKNLGAPTTNTVFTHTCLSPIFYRVVSLPNP